MVVNPEYIIVNPEYIIINPGYMFANTCMVTNPIFYDENRENRI